MSRAARGAGAVRSPGTAFEYPCMHCGTDRLVFPISEFIGCNRRLPLPGMSEPLEALLRLYGPSRRVSMCPGCWCLTAQLTGAHTD